ncbi:hypothetical protein FRC19_011941 [Serendipita sp. 401]|nr:hypothetical protein FRC19_011941 [Serendipita sp. 401]
MSSSPQPFAPQYVVGIVRTPGPPLQTPQLQDIWPIRTATGYPNGPFVSRCFQHLLDEEAQRLRTILSGVFKAQWWRGNSFADAPAAVLDVFVHRPIDGDGFVCQFCNESHANAQVAVSCVRGHINV